MNAQAKIGALVVVAMLIAGWLILRIENLTIGRERGKTFVVTMPQAQGLAAKSPVLLRGVRVGRVTGLTLVGEDVHANLVVEEQVRLHEGATARVSSVGLLGEKQLDLLPGDVSKPLLPDGTLIAGRASTSLDDVFARLADITSDVSGVTGNVKEALSEERLSSLLTETTGLAKQMKELVAANQDSVKQGVESTRRVVEGLARLERQLEKALSAGTGGSGTEGEGDGGANTAEQLKAIVANLEVISSRIAAGEGTVGKLVGQDATAQKLDTALDSANEGLSGVSDTLGWFQRTRVGVAIRGEYLTATDTGKAGAMVEVMPPSPGFLRLELVSLASQLEAGERDVAYSVQGGYRFPHVALRAGIFESRPGLGADAYVVDDQLRFTAELWDARIENLRPHGRVEAAVSPLRWFSLVGGWDDVLNGRDGLDSLYFGGRLQLVPKKSD